MKLRPDVEQRIREDLKYVGCVNDFAECTSKWRSECFGFMLHRDYFQHYISQHIDIKEARACLENLRDKCLARERYEQLYGALKPKPLRQRLLVDAAKILAGALAGWLLGKL